jgi:hypothetical protein
MRTLALVIVLGSVPAAADLLKMKQVDSTNMHMADQRGAMHWSEDITVTVDLGAKGRVQVLSKGTRGEHNLDVINNTNYNTDETTTWTTAWKGAWKIEKGALVMQLGLVKDDCKAEKDDNGTKTPMTCKAAKNAVMRCSAASVELEVGTKKQKTAAWRCAPDDARDLGESPSSWLLGKKRCIEVHAGRMMPMSFVPCP